MAAQREQYPDEVTQLAASLAHQLNNLLQVVQGNLEIVGARLEDERLRPYLTNAMIASQQLTDLARQLHDDPLETISPPCLK